MAAYDSDIGDEAAVAYLIVGQVAVYVLYEAVISKDDVAKDGICYAAASAKAFFEFD